MRLAMVVGLVLGLAGCASVTGDKAASTPGMASYHLRSGDCEVTVASGREVDQARLVIGPDCTVEAEARSLSAAEQQTMLLGIIERLIGDRLP